VGGGSEPSETGDSGVLVVLEDENFAPIDDGDVAVSPPSLRRRKMLFETRAKMGRLYLTFDVEAVVFAVETVMFAVDTVF
jgi:hypothetical protein